MKKIYAVWQESLKYPKIYPTTLRSMLNRHGVELEVLEVGWLPTWWAKLELFNIPGPVRYLDLDTVVVGSPDFLFEPVPEGIKMLWEDAENGAMANSCIMGWDEDLSCVMKEFKKRPNEIMEEYKALPKLGDQAFIYDTLTMYNKPVGFWDPEPLIHFRDVLAGADWAGKSIAWWTAQPKPASMRGHPLVKEHWK